MTAVRTLVPIDYDPAATFLRWCEGQVRHNEPTMSFRINNMDFSDALYSRFEVVAGVV